ncbi:Formyltransferase [Athelia psychrophila]|uniref:methionyl-tRNA formyltransferase n=1 Tax=Athelia psychrophila TaxID=1759441 RepID=A0A166WG41_9AGAM|nr:Formyltransferase [Fibularhizoctonia sp. CBS 109695]
MPFLLARIQCRPTLRVIRALHSASSSGRNPFEILFMGGDEFSAGVFEQLVAAKDVYNSILVASYTPAHVHARYKKLKSSVPPLVALTNTHNVPTLQPPAPFISPDPETHRNHLLVTASFGRILPKPFLELFPSGQRLNVHPSSLPAYRGPAPLQRTLMNAEKTTGVCVIETLPYKMGIDAGPVWGRVDCDVPRESTFETLRDHLACEGGQLLVSVLREMLRGTAIARPQNDASGLLHAPFITADDANINFHELKAEDIVRHHRAISHMRPLFTHVHDKALQLLDVSVYDPTPTDPNSHSHSQVQPGLARYDPHTRSILVACAGGSVLSLSKVKQQDRNAISAKEWWNGVRGEWKDAEGAVLFRRVAEGADE